MIFSVGVADHGDAIHAHSRLLRVHLQSGFRQKVGRIQGRHLARGSTNAVSSLARQQCERRTQEAVASNSVARLVGL